MALNTVWPPPGVGTIDDPNDESGQSSTVDIKQDDVAEQLDEENAKASDVAVFKS